MFDLVANGPRAAPIFASRVQHVIRQAQEDTGGSVRGVQPELSATSRSAATGQRRASLKSLRGSCAGWLIGRRHGG